MNKKIISYSLWGENPKYWIGAVKNIELAKELYPDWICRFYIDNKCSQKLIDTICGNNVEKILIESKGAYHGMFWRFFAASDETVDIMISRDCDSRLSKREVLCVKEWLESDKDFHIMRDHPYHTVPILGGMWGCRNKIIFNMVPRINLWNDFSNHGIDQDFLSQIIYPLIKNNSFEHIDFNLNFGGNIHPFPSKRVNFEYIGESYDENEIRDCRVGLHRFLC